MPSMTPARDQKVETPIMAEPIMVVSIMVEPAMAEPKPPKQSGSGVVEGVAVVAFGFLVVVIA